MSIDATACGACAGTAAGGGGLPPLSPRTQGQAEHPRYLALDALRGVAALAVLYHHLLNGEVSGKVVHNSLFFGSAYLAVDFFFVLSGFVLSHAYGARLGRDLSLGAFLATRLVRLQPVIVTGTLVGFFLSVAQHVAGRAYAPGFFAVATALPLNLMMLPDVLIPWGMFLFNPPAWSLFYELLANVLYALGMRWRGARSASGAKANDWCQHALTALCLAGFAGIVTGALKAGSLDHGLLRAEWPMALARISYSFFGGVLLHRFRDTWMPRIPSIGMPELLIACALLLSMPIPVAARASFDIIFAAALSPLLVMLGANARPSLRLRPLAVWLGMVSYPLYALHAPVKHWIETFLSLGLLPSVALNSTVSLPLAWLMGSTIDPFIRRRLTERLNAGAQTARSTAAARIAARTQACVQGRT